MAASLRCAGVSLDFESKTSYVVGVTVDDKMVGSTPDATSSYTLKVSDVNEAPVLSNVAGSASYTENAPPVALASGIVVNDVDNATLAFATVRIADGGLAGDELAINRATTGDLIDGTNIRWNYNSATQTLLLSGTDTLENYQDVLDDVTFASTSENPTNFGVSNTRTIEWQINDGTPLVGSLFSAQSQFGAGDGSRSVAAADFNADGIVDLALANRWSNDVSIVLGNGDGTFLTATSFAAGTGPFSIATGDFDGDGASDLVVANAFSGDISLLLGNGDGTFRDATSFTAGGSPFDVAASDLNGDGYLDVVVANQGDASVLLGDGSGSFEEATSFAAGLTPWSVDVGDLNNDGTLDLAIANVNSDNVSVLLGNGDGTFAAANNFAADAKPSSVAIGDLNGDGSLDLVVTNYKASGTVSLLFGNGSGTFSAPTSFAVGTHPTGVAIGDLNGDGISDLAVANIFSDNVSVLLGSGSGFFAAAVNFLAGSGPLTVAIDDLDGNGSPDLVAANQNSDNISVLLNTTTSLSLVQRSTIAITAQNDSLQSPVDINAAENWVVEGAANGSTVAVTAVATDPDSTPTYALTDDAGGRFAIGVNSGVVTVANGVLLDFDTATSHSITVQASDGAGGTSTQSFTINVSNVNPTAPVDNDASANSVAEGAANGTMVGVTASSTDPAGPAVTYTLADSAGGRFTIGLNSGVVTVLDGTLLDFETTTSHSITVQASDGAGGTSTQNFTIDLADVVPTTPVDNDTAINSVAEGAMNGTAVGVTAFAVDPGSPAAIYTLTDDAGGIFAINSSSGVVTVLDGTLLDFETTTSHSIIVQVAFGIAGTTAQTFTIAVTDVVDVTIRGSKNSDLVNATNTAPGQPLPNSEANTILGNKGNDDLSGLAGADTINGGEGRDILRGGDGDDILQVRQAEGTFDTFDGGAGTDTLQFIGPGKPITTLASFDATAFSIETLLGNSRPLHGTAAANVFDFSGLTATTGVPFVDAKKGDDTLIGSDFADDLRGGEGRDILDGRGGNDFLRGGNGIDIYVFADGYDADSVTGYQAGLDIFDFTGVAGVHAFGDLQLTQVNPTTVLIDFDGVLGGDTMTVQKTTVAVLIANQSDFLFV